MQLSSTFFTSLGLSQSETQVYLAALELGSGTIQELSRKSGVKRTSIYNFIDKLTAKQVLSETKKGKRSVYSAVHPLQLFETLKSQLQEYKRVLPELLSLHERSKREPHVTFYPGREGIKEVYHDALRKAEPIRAWTDWEPMMKLMGNFLDTYPSERASRGIPLYQITRDSKTAREIAKRDKRDLRQTKYMDCSDLKTEIMIYGENVALMSFRKQQPIGIVIEDPDIAETLRVLWNEQWERIE